MYMYTGTCTSLNDLVYVQCSVAAAAVLATFVLCLVYNVFCAYLKQNLTRSYVKLVIWHFKKWAGEIDKKILISMYITQSRNRFWLAGVLETQNLYAKYGSGCKYSVPLLSINSSLEWSRQIFFRSVFVLVSARDGIIFKCANSARWLSYNFWIFKRGVI